MNSKNTLETVALVIDNLPSNWLNLTTHRLDIYQEDQAKTQFLEAFQKLVDQNSINTQTLAALPTAYDYIRLGHPLSCILEWAIAQENGLSPKNVIAFSSKTAPILAVLRKNLLANQQTLILHNNSLPESFDPGVVKRVYGYDFELKSIEEEANYGEFNGNTLFVTSTHDFSGTDFLQKADFTVSVFQSLGSIIVVNEEVSEEYISEIQHVRRRETIAMTPVNCLDALKSLIGEPEITTTDNLAKHKNHVLSTISKITNTEAQAVVGSSGLSVQYAIMMGLIDHAKEHHPGKAIKFLVPPNCYGGTNDQARRVAACIDEVDILDLPVDVDYDMVSSIDRVVNEVAEQDAVPYIIAEIPTNPRVEVPNLHDLKTALAARRKTAQGATAIEPVFILDQTFCPNVHFLGANDILSNVPAIAYVSGSKFPSGGQCTAGYCVVNNKAKNLLEKIQAHLDLCDNEATNLQYQILANQMPSMIQRIQDAYINTRDFVNFIQETLPSAKINFVTEELAELGFTPSVFSLDLPTKGNTHEEREAYKRALNLKLINMMINQIPDESKYCVSYGQLKGCYWTIPATSTQGTTKEEDKDYIARVSIAPNIDLERHKAVFTEFVEGL